VDSWPWSLLNIVAWSIGLKAVYDLRAEHAPGARTWALLTWALWNCLAMEIAMLGASVAPALQLLSVTTGILAACLVYGGIWSLLSDLRQGSETSGGFPVRLAGRFLVPTLAVTAAVSSAVAPEYAVAAANVLHPVEGLAWTVVSASLVVALARTSLEPWQAHVFRPGQLIVAFTLSFLGAALTPMAWILRVHVPSQVSALMSTLFLLTLVTALYGTVIRLRSRNLATAMSQVHAYEQQILVVEKLTTVSTLAAGAAHDFNNALTTIMGFTELVLQRPELPLEVRDDVEQIRTAAQSAAVVAGGLLGFARKTAGPHVLTDVRAAVLQPLSLLEKEFRRKGIVVKVVTPVAVPGVRLALETVSGVCLNLYLNARDAIAPKGGGSLTVSLSVDGADVVVSVRDTGTGIPADFLGRMFQPLQTTKGDRGTGLGLSVSKRVIEAAGGHITFTTEEGLGTEFEVRLPALETDGSARVHNPAREIRVASC